MATKDETMTDKTLANRRLIELFTNAQKLSQVSIYLGYLAIIAFCVFGTLASMASFRQNVLVYWAFHYLPYVLIGISVPMSWFLVFWQCDWGVYVAVFGDDCVVCDAIFVPCEHQTLPKLFNRIGKINAHLRHHRADLPRTNYATAQKYPSDGKWRVHCHYRHRPCDHKRHSQFLSAFGAYFA